MPESAAVVINIDGAARGNPGPAAFAYVLARPGQPPLEAKGRLGTATNNVAEYTALIRALEKAVELGAKGEVLVRSDSELLVKQMNGEYRVKNESLRSLYEEARQLIRRLGPVQFTHVYREENRDADRLCNEALDGRDAAAASTKGKARNSAPRRVAAEASSSASDTEFAVIEILGKLGPRSAGDQAALFALGREWDLDLSDNEAWRRLAGEAAGRLARVKGELVNDAGRLVIRVAMLQPVECA